MRSATTSGRQIFNKLGRLLQDRLFFFIFHAPQGCIGEFHAHIPLQFFAVSPEKMPVEGVEGARFFPRHLIWIKAAAFAEIRHAIDVLAAGCVGL